MMSNMKYKPTGEGYIDAGRRDGSGYRPLYTYGYGGHDGCGYGKYPFENDYGSGYGNSYGITYRDHLSRGKEIYYPEEYSFFAYHFIRKLDENLILKSGKIVKKGDMLHEDKIELCMRGFHSSLSIKNARIYAPEDSVLTKVKVWGHVVFDEDKLVSTDRMIIEVLTARKIY